jgi:hypothetical protein
VSVPRNPRPAASLVATVVALLAVAGCSSTTEPTVTPTTLATTAAPAPLPTPTSSPTPSWPAALGEADALSSPENYAAVWLTTTREQPADAFGPIVDRAAALGYDVGLTPVTCVDVAPVSLVGDENPGDVMGLPVYFATKAEADTFVDLWGEPVTAVLDDVHLACDWD